MASSQERNDAEHVITLILASLAGITVAWLAGVQIDRLPHTLAVYTLRLMVLLMALSLHEYAHAVTACALGDPTARDAGRMSLNPVVHFDLAGLVLVPVLLSVMHAPFMLGWAAPVPVDFDRLKRPRLGMFLVAAAGPAASIFAAISIAVVLRIAGIDGSLSLAASIAWLFVLTNLFIGIFNLLPLYPMDGGRMLASILPGPAFFWLRKHERKAAIVAVLILVGGPWVIKTVDPSMSVFITVGEGASSLMSQIVGVEGLGWYGPTQQWIIGHDS